MSILQDMPSLLPMRCSATLPVLESYPFAGCSTSNVPSDAEFGGETAFPRGIWLDEKQQTAGKVFSDCAKGGVAAAARKVSGRMQVGRAGRQGSGVPSDMTLLLMTLACPPSFTIPCNHCSHSKTLSRAMPFFSGICSQTAGSWIATHCMQVRC